MVRHRLIRNSSAMPTIAQLPVATIVTPSDEIPLSQSGITRNVAVSTLLAGIQPAITAATGTLVGRVSLGPGSVESVSLGTGITMQTGALVATGLDHLAFPLQGTLSLTDDIVLNSAGHPLQMPVSKLLGLYQPGANITIGPTGIIAASALNGPAGPTGAAGAAGATGPAGATGTAASIASLPATLTVAATDFVGISQTGANHAITLGNLLANTDVSATRVLATGGLTAYPTATHLGRRLDPRDFATSMFSGAMSQDDGIGIQAAIAYAQTQGGGIIQLPDHGAVNGQLATPLVISQSGVCLIGQSRSLLVHDDLGPYPECAVKLRWIGATGATMLRVAPPVNTTTGIPVSGCDIRGLLLDCNGIAAVGAYFASMRLSLVDLMVTEATADGVLLDTIDIGEANDTQNNEFSLLIRILTTKGNALRLAGTARLNQLGNASYNRFRLVSVTHNAGDAIVFDYADSNLFDKALIQNRPSFSTTLGTPGAGRSIVFKGSSEIVVRTGGNVTMFGANNNVFNQLSCPGPIASLGTQSGYTSPALENRILRFDVGNNPLNLATDTGATIQVSTTDNLDLALTASQPSFANLATTARLLRDNRGTEALAVASTTGDHVQLYQSAVKMWGYGIDGATNDLRFAGSNSAAGQLNLGNGQGAYSLNGFGVGIRVPAGTPPGIIYLVDAGSKTIPIPTNGLAFYVSNGTLMVQGTNGAKTAIAPMPLATATGVGGIKVGANLAVAGDGTLSAAAPGTGPPGPAGPVYAPPRRTVTAASDTPALTDDQGTIAYTSSLATTVTVADLGALRRYATLQTGTGTVTFVPGTGVALYSQGKAVTSVVAAYQGAAVTVIGTGTGRAYLIGNTL
jgi:hypothetical protein